MLTWQPRWNKHTSAYQIICQAVSFKWSPIVFLILVCCILANVSYCMLQYYCTSGRNKHKTYGTNTNIKSRLITFCLPLGPFLCELLLARSLSRDGSGLESPPQLFKLVEFPILLYKEPFLCATYFTHSSARFWAVFFSLSLVSCFPVIASTTSDRR